MDDVGEGRVKVVQNFGSGRLSLFKYQSQLEDEELLISALRE